MSEAGKALHEAIDNDSTLSDNPQTCPDGKAADNDNPQALTPRLGAYLPVAWVPEADSACEGFGFPFDRPPPVFHQRLRQACPALKKLKAEGVSVLPLSTLHRMPGDAALQNLVRRIERKITLFDRLREAMRIARPHCGRGLDDDGDGEIETIESRVKAFRCSKTIKALSASDIGYRKMAEQIDKYRDKLFADPIAVNTPAGTVMIQPQRTNNLMEQSFRLLKRDGRRKTGQKALSRTWVAMLADTPLVRNLDNPDYMRILLNGKATLAARFADIDIRQVREEEQANNNRFRKYPENMRRLFRVPHLPRKIMKAASM